MRKKLFAILMSAMMMVTFMPAMAFADASKTISDIKWNDNCQGAYVMYGTEKVSLDAPRILFNNSTGKTTASFGDQSDVESLLQAKYGFKFGDDIDEIAFAFSLKNKEFYDFTGAKLAYTTASGNYEIPAEYETKADFDSVFGTNGLGTSYRVDGIIVYEPSYVTTKQSSKVGFAAISGTTNRTLDNWTYKLEKPEYEVSTTEDQTFTVAPEFTTTTEETSPSFVKIIGSISKTLTLKKIALTENDAKFYVDSTTGKELTGASHAVVYDGAEHTVVMNNIDGYKVTYTKFNKNTGAYDETVPSFKGVGTYTFYAKVEDVATGLKYQNYTITVSVGQANVYVALESAPAVYEGQKYEATDFLAVTFGDDNGASQKAAAADAEALKAYFAEKWEVKAVADKYNNVKLYLLAKTGIDTAAIEAKYKDLTNNISLHVTPCTAGRDLTINEGKLENEVEFTKAPTSMTYHVKKAKGLKKNNYITVKAEALSGVAPSYKLINANSKIKINKTTGKITLKKGLKKGTYNIKVKAYGAAGNGYVAASETQAIKIVVKK